MSIIALCAIRSCFDGDVPSTIATCDMDGMPNVAYVSHVNFVDAQHVALSHQFFNKTKFNLLQNPRAVVNVVDPETAQQYSLTLIYVRTEEAGPVFESMKTRLHEIAAMTGMSEVFHLKGADIFRVVHVAALPRTVPCLPRAPVAGRLHSLRQAMKAIQQCQDLDTLFDQCLSTLAEHFGMANSVLLMADESLAKLYAVASYGYQSSGIGAEVEVGEGVIGLVARERTSIRINHLTPELLYGKSVMENFAGKSELERQIPLPNLEGARTQLAVPILHHGQLLGVLYCESHCETRFGFEDEDALAIYGIHLGLMLSHLSTQGRQPRVSAVQGEPGQGTAVVISYHACDQSVFIDGQYLIRGVAGSIFWKLMRDYKANSLTEFTNRGLKLDPSIGLPELSANLETRLILLKRRLVERSPCIAIERIGRGRYALRVDRPVVLEDAGAFNLRT